MKSKISLSFILIVLSLSTLWSCYGSLHRQVIKIGVGKITFNKLIEEISSASVIFIGETHNNPRHHKTQLDILRAFHKRNLLLVIGLEMFPEKEQKKLDDWVSGKIREKAFIPIFHKNWGPGWELYRDIFLYAREKKIPLIGLNVPEKISRKVAEEGFRSLTKDELSELPPGITCELDQRYMDFIRRVFEQEIHNKGAFRNFCESQVIWDQSMAWHLSQYLKRNPGRTIVVLTGTIHAWKYGMPRQLEKYTTVKYKVILPEIPGDYSTITKEDADYMVLH